MIYPSDFENKIGFTSIRLNVKGKCESEMGRELADSMRFNSRFETVSRELNCVEEMKRILSSPMEHPDIIFYDIVQWLKRTLTPGSFLNGEELYKIAKTMMGMSELNRFFNSDKYSLISGSFLKKEFESIPAFPELVSEICRCVEKSGEIRDNASPELGEIRKSIESLSKSMHKILAKIIDENIRAGFLDKDVSPSLREGHYVIPVNAVNRRNIKGIMHDTSSTGKTVFIEPVEVFEAGNRMRSLQADEEQEIINILTRLTELLHPELDNIIEGCKKMARYDFIRAKARFAIETDGQLPVLEKKPEIDWFHAVHPGLLLTLRSQGREVVPLYITLSSKDRILIISGPNAGGKSVVLKTVGTVQYMMQCGLLPTLHSNSHMGLFSNIFIDIGDQQSMENDLSTYSSHLSNMKYFLSKADSSTLFLVDEMGSGTEPQIGAAIAQAVLDQLGKSGCFGIITTHYQNLKIFADNTEGFVNGAMAYDRQLLRPTFQLSIGQPGSSFALEIARNIGLPEIVVANAKDLVGSEYVDSEKFLMDIQRDRKYWKNKRLDIKEKENKLNKLLEEYEDTAKDLKNKRNEILRQAREEAKSILSGANRQIERSISEIRKSQADKEKSKAVRQDLVAYKEKLEKELHEESRKEVIKPARHKSKRAKNEKSATETSFQKNIVLKEDDYVKMDHGGSEGKILSISGNKAEVAFGNLRTTVDLKRLVKVNKPVDKPSQGYVFSSSEISDAASRKRQLNFKPEIDVRGMRADEAMQAVVYFIDDALQFNASKVRILHGTGHGILKDVIRRQLKSNPAVESLEDEDVRFGGAGITVVELK
ncbi:MAG: Smr/MutS family protein [Muribaculaceae bacterium]|nr:Smr/MutS family protein [Muribaculaceae bacterium]